LSSDNAAVSGVFDWGYKGFYPGTWGSSTYYKPGLELNLAYDFGLSFTYGYQELDETK
jgi:hypothetical protein